MVRPYPHPQYRMEEDGWPPPGTSLLKLAGKDCQPLFREDLLERMLHPPFKHWCLKGPSGTGKTHLAKIFAQRAGKQWHLHNASEEVTMQCIRQMTEECKCSPLVWIIDEANMLTGLVLKALHGLTRNPNLTLILVCNSHNFPDSLLSRVELCEFSPYTDEEVDSILEQRVFEPFPALKGCVASHRQELVRAAGGNMRTVLQLLDQLVGLRHRGLQEQLEEQLDLLQRDAKVQESIMDFLWGPALEETGTATRDLLYLLQEEHVPWSQFLDTVSLVVAGFSCQAGGDVMCKSILLHALSMLALGDTVGGRNSLEREFQLFAFLALWQQMWEVNPAMQQRLC